MTLDGTLALVREFFGRLLHIFAHQALVLKRIGKGLLLFPDYFLLLVSEKIVVVAEKFLHALFEHLPLFPLFLSERKIGPLVLDLFGVLL